MNIYPPKVSSRLLVIERLYFYDESLILWKLLSCLDSAVVFLFGLLQSQNGFEELRLHVKEGGDLCKELSSILQERLVPKLRHAVRVAVPCGHASLLFCATTGKEKQNEDARILLGRANRGLVSLSICWSVK